MLIGFTYLKSALNLMIINTIEECVTGIYWYEFNSGQVLNSKLYVLNEQNYLH